MNTPAARGGQGSEMRIDAIDIYWARLPLLKRWTAAHAAVRG